MPTPVLGAYTTVGLNLIAGAQLPGAPSPQIQYVAVGSGAGVLSAALVAGTPITSLPVQALAAGLAGGQQLVIVYQTYSDLVTVAAGGIGPGATAIPITSWTPTYAFPAGSGLVNQPSAGDTQLQAEAYRAVYSAATPGVGAGETLLSGYFDPVATPSGSYVEAGWFAGPTATGAANTGTLLARGVIWWQHTQNQDSFSAQLDGAI